MAKGKSKPKARSAQQIKEFQRKLKILKKHGLYKGPVGIEKRTPARDKLLRQYKGVIEGDKTTIKLTPKQLKEIDRRKVKVVNGRAIIPNEKGFKAAFKKGLLTYTKPIGDGRIHEKVSLPASKNLRKQLEELKNDPRFEGMKAGNERWAFRFYGGNSMATYASLEQLIEEFEKYETVTNALNSRGTKSHKDIIENFEIHRLKKGASRKWHQETNKRNTSAKAKQRSARQRARANEMQRIRMNRLKADPVAYAAFKEEKAAYARKKWKHLKRYNKAKYKERLAQMKRYQKT